MTLIEAVKKAVTAEEEASAVLDIYRKSSRRTLLRIHGGSHLKDRERVHTLSVDDILADDWEAS